MPRRSPRVFFHAVIHHDFHSNHLLDNKIIKIFAVFRFARLGRDWYQCSTGRGRLSSEIRGFCSKIAGIICFLSRLFQKREGQGFRARPAVPGLGGWEARMSSKKSVFICGCS
jgi:hypothetical protein